MQMTLYQKTFSFITFLSLFVCGIFFHFVLSLALPLVLEAKELGKVRELWKELEQRSWLSCCCCCSRIEVVVVVQVVIVN
jgi:hypothetical protein